MVTLKHHVDPIGLFKFPGNVQMCPTIMQSLESIRIQTNLLQKKDTTGWNVKKLEKAGSESHDRIDTPHPVQQAEHVSKLTG